MTSSTSRPATLLMLQELCRNATLGKYRHFSAARRSHLLNAAIGAPVVMINIALGSLFFVTLSKELPEFAKWLGAFCALLAALLSGMQTFFNFRKSFEGHRRIANRYLELARNCASLESQFDDGLAILEVVAKELEHLNHSYSQINTDAEAFPTAERDFKVALALEEKRVLTLAYRNKKAIESGGK